MVWVRSPRTCNLIDGGRWALQFRQHVLHALHRLIDVVARLLVNIDDDGAHAAQPSGLAAFDAVDGLAEIADAHRRAVAVTIVSLKAAASKTWSVVSRVRDCFGPSSVPFGEFTVAVAERRADVFETDADRRWPQPG
jgi:hypothetical protein